MIKNYSRKLSLDAKSSGSYKGGLEHNLEIARNLVKQVYENANLADTKNFRGELTCSSPELNSTHKRVAFYNENNNFRSQHSNKNSHRSETS